MFFSFDGIDGVGKSTQVALFIETLTRTGFEVAVCRDPGSTPLGERIRDVLLSSDSAIRIGRRSEMLLYMAARAQLVDEVIRPALEAGRVVVADRFLLANVVYQGHAGGLDPAQIWQVGRIAIDGILPDCIFLLDMNPKCAIQRLNRSLDRMESRGDEYRDRLRAGFLKEAQGAESRIHVIDAARPVEAVRAEIWQIAAKMFQLPQ
ncbi:MAG TPA: dTMP kinase [Lacipirellulaceae bacterium]|nr:dTMP kinase [Lacipirellulaceae bacterium]